MPVTAIPFKSPPPFALPEHLVSMLEGQPFDQAAQQVLELLLDAGCADVMALSIRASGTWSPAAALGLDERLSAVARQVAVEGGAYMAQALDARQPMLLMGEVAEGEPDALSPAFRDYLLAGAVRANLGFVYVFPLPHAALVLHRPLATGPLNHDQPAITQAMVDLLSGLAPGA